MRISLLVLLLSGCSWLDDDSDEPTVVTVVPDSPSSLDGCRGETVRGDHLRVSIPATNAAIVVASADDWHMDCTRSQDPDGSAQLMSLSSESQHSSAYILSLNGPGITSEETALDSALAEMREVWQMSGSVDIDRPFPSRPVAVLRATDGDSSEVTWQVVTVSKDPNNGWVRIHQTWSCGDCNLDAMGTKSVIDTMVAAASGWGFSG